MTIYSSSRIYIGNFAPMDTDETNFGNENDNGVLGTYNFSSMEMSAMTVDDADDDGIIRSDDRGQTAETVTYTVGGITYTSTHDAEAIYKAVITYGDGTTANINIEVYQNEDGSTFLSLDTGLDNVDIQQIQLLSVLSDNYRGYNHLHDFGLDGSAIVCFRAGTSIATPMGDVLVEDIQIGDDISTYDCGPQTVRWVGGTTVAATGAFAPVLIKKGALGNAHDLYVSQQHRMLVSGWRAELLFGKPEVLIPAVHLLNDTNILLIEGGDVQYFHMLFDQHQLIFANGAIAESLHPGKQTMDSLTAASRAEILQLFPMLQESVKEYGVLARQSLRAFEARALLNL